MGTNININLFAYRSYPALPESTRQTIRGQARCAARARGDAVHFDSSIVFSFRTAEYHGNTVWHEWREWGGGGKGCGGILRINDSLADRVSNI